ncbi:hypothetical protein AOQ84DRAFT_354851 [Glonium stellatum]|uniref:DUF952 domain-containing protein n=1 Tax=Glonium stellatum TaxID=574774 RepID=A0A8E2EZK0_9PEZI|nr:hypothetical protein AOQ84DRAFT_354851 [Glonium stellatum]
MPPPAPLPSHVFKILLSAPPSPLPKALPLSKLDAQDSFIHLSTGAQVPGTASRFFAQTNLLYLLKIPVRKLEEGEGELKWEENNTEWFPHLYGADIGADEVHEVIKVERNEAKGWEDVLTGVLEKH